MKIYIASSWKNKIAVRELARKLLFNNFDVYDFTDNSKHFSFNFNDIENKDTYNAKTIFNIPETIKAFNSDKNGIDNADCIILLMPCGNSSCLEFGYAIGKGKKLGIIYAPLGFVKGEFDVMFKFANYMCENYEDLLQYMEQF